MEALIGFFKNLFIAHKKEKKVRKAIPKKVRDEVWIAYHGESEKGACYVCEKRIERYNAGWHCSHVVAHANGGRDTVHNLRTLCPGCNLAMGKKNMHVFMAEKKLGINKNRKRIK